MAITEDAVRDVLKNVFDPELFVNIVDLGLVYLVNVQPNAEGKSDVYIEMTMTSPMCPAAPQLIMQSKQAILRMEDVGSVDIKIVMAPPWTPDRMTDDARDQLGIF